MQQKYSLEIRDGEKVIWEKTGQGFKGLNQIRWDLVIENLIISRLILSITINTFSAANMISI